MRSVNRGAIGNVFGSTHRVKCIERLIPMNDKEEIPKDVSKGWIFPKVPERVSNTSIETVKQKSGSFVAGVTVR